MSPTIPDPSLAAPISAACRLAESFGHSVDRCEILQNGHTLVVRLSESLVARIVNDPLGPRQGTGWFEREIAVASHLARHGAPVIPAHPEVPPGPFERDTYPINFWQFVTRLDGEPTLADMASALHPCLETLRSFPGPLPRLAILHETRRLFDAPSRLSPLTASQQELLAVRLEESIALLDSCPSLPLHGDAHPGNAMLTTRGLLWTDWEDTFSGPVEWDLASLIWNHELLHRDHHAVHAALRAFRLAGGDFDPLVLQHALVARAAVMCAWYPILYPDLSAERQEKLHRRLDWLVSPVRRPPRHFYA